MRQVPDQMDYDEYFGVCLNCQCELTEDFVVDEDYSRFCDKKCRREWKERWI